MGLLLRGSAIDIAWASGTAVLGVMALSAGFGGWMRRAATLPERALAVAGGVLLFYPAGLADVGGAALTATAVCAHLWRTRGMR
jgi:TRAP-type uncharacterized transport system fused permease subunit